jgi:hypothetical protein
MLQQHAVVRRETHAGAEDVDYCLALMEDKEHHNKRTIKTKIG